MGNLTIKKNTANHRITRIEIIRVILVSIFTIITVTSAAFGQAIVSAISGLIAGLLLGWVIKNPNILKNKDEKKIDTVKMGGFIPTSEPEREAPDGTAKIWFEP
jgi:membrane associated rhomboid family serine protease